MIRVCGAWVVLASLLSVAWGQGPTVGWRGNWIGAWPDADAPIRWSRTPRGATQGLRCFSDRAPKPGDKDKAAPVQHGLISRWLIAGPFAVGNSLKDFDAAQIPDEGQLSPSEGDSAGAVKWQPLTIEHNRWDFGRAELEWTEVGKLIGVEPNRVAYAHTYLYAPRAGKVRCVLQHHFGLKVWLNGRQVYSSPKREVVLGYYTQISKMKLANINPHAPAIELDLAPGWNRLTCKLSTAPDAGWKDMQFTMRLGEPENVEYDNQNMRWMAPLPERGNATPIIVGDRIFVMAEPDELLCIDRITGIERWRAWVNYESALSAEERAANPRFAQEVDPLRAALAKENDDEKRLEIRRKLNETLLSIDRKKFSTRLDGHLEGHFAIVGFATPTPCSDGKHVSVWTGTGVAACFDFDGKRQWINRVAGDKLLYYASSPALIGGKLIVFMKKLYGLDTATGKIAWVQDEVEKNNASIMPAKLAGVEVVVTQQGEVVRASDGAILYRNPRKGPGDSGWAAPTILGNTVHLPWNGVSELIVFDFAGCSGDEWKPKVATISGIAINKRPDGKWLDRFTPASPMISGGLMFNVDIYMTMYGVDLASKQTLYRQDLPLSGIFHYNAVPIGASGAIIGKYLYVVDNQGTCLVIEPGRQFKLVAKNVLGTQLQRSWPISPQETTTYAPVITDGKCLYIRGERYLYCIGAQ